MDGFWIGVVVGLAVGAAAVAVMLITRSWRGNRQPPEVPVSAAVEPAPSAGPPVARPDVWLEQLLRCEQAVCRGYRAADTVSSAQVRRGLQTVMRRMEAELPDVRALVELGRGLGPEQSDVADRIRGQLGDASARFVLVTDQVLNLVVELVAAPDLDRVHEQVSRLRGEFPLLRPMSAMHLGSTMPREEAA